MKKVFFFMVCIFACVTMCMMSNWTDTSGYNDMDSGIIPLVFSMLSIAALVISMAIKNPWITVALMLGSVFCAIQNGTDALLVYIVCVISLGPVARFDEDICNMIRSFWAPEKK